MKSRKIRVLDWHALDIKLVWAYEGAPIVPKGKVGGNRQIAWLVRKGLATVYKDGAPITAEQDEWLFPPQGDVERSFSEDAIILSVSSSIQWSNRRFLVELDQPLVCPSEQCPLLKEIAVRLLQVLHDIGAGNGNGLLLQQLDLQSYLQCNQLLLSWTSAYVDCLSRLGVKPYIMAASLDRPKMIMDRLDATSIAEAFDAEVLSAQVGLSSRQLSRIFKSAYGITPRDYWNRRRLGWAMTALNGETQSIKHIAYECGFASPALFTRWFTHLAGVSPTTFRHQKTNPQASLTSFRHEALQVPPAKPEPDDGEAR